MKSTLIKSKTCEDCLFFERVRSPIDTHYTCRFYNKGSYEMREDKFPFCKVECIFVSERD
jgi:hypothetical protein